MAQLLNSGREAKTIFSVYGRDEDTLTNGLGYLLTRSPSLAREVLRQVGIDHLYRFDDTHASELFTVRLQTHRKEGITDLEIVYGDQVSVTIEAKRDARLPTKDQLSRYATAIGRTSTNKRILCTLTADKQCASDWLSTLASEKVFIDAKVTLVALDWGDVVRCVEHAESVTGHHYERGLLSEYRLFVTEEYFMHNYFDAEVWVCTVNPWREVGDGGITFMDITLKHHLYFHPIDRNRRKCLYFAPKYHAKIERLLRIKSTAIGNPVDRIPALAPNEWTHVPHTMFDLGQPIELPRPVRFAGMSHTYCTVEDLFTKSEL